ncbi:MAG: DUF4407 domain-containing protein [Bacteroidetes bacterium]|nr:DUF4407 domain-containing protein [Bacteroidota bacterium]
MIHNKSHPKFFPLVAQVLRPVKKYYYQCTEETQRAIKNLSLVLLFTVTVCGAVFAASICKFCLGGDFHLFIPVFAITAFFYYLIDKPIIFSEIKPNRKMIKWIRIFIALILGLFNSFLIDSFYFKDDITAARNIEMKEKEMNIRADFATKDSLLNVQKLAFIQQVDYANTGLSVKRDSLNREADGSGGSGNAGMKDIWKSKYSMYQADSIEVAKQNGVKQSEMGKLDTALAANATLMQVQIADLPNQISTGINKSMELLHKVIWLDGNFTNILMSILILIISMIFELAPLISKSFYDISEYFEKCMNQKDVKDKEAIMVKNKELNIVSRRVVLEQKREETKMTRENAESSLLETVEYNKDILAHTTAELNRLEAMDAKMKKRYPQYYETHIKPVLERSYLNLHNSAKAAISQN